MPKTYNSIPTVSTGDVYTATAHNNIVTNVNNYRVPPMIAVELGPSNKTLTSGADVVWDRVKDSIDTDGMWTSGATVTVNTSGLYLVTLQGRVTSSASGSFAIEGLVRRNTTTVLNGVFATLDPGGARTDYRSTLSQVVSFTAAQTVTARITGAGTLTGDGTNDGLRLTLSLMWLGQVS